MKFRHQHSFCFSFIPLDTKKWCQAKVRTSTRNDKQNRTPLRLSDSTPDFTTLQTGGVLDQNFRFPDCPPYRYVFYFLPFPSRSPGGAGRVRAPSVPHSAFRAGTCTIKHNQLHARLRYLEHKHKRPRGTICALPHILSGISRR